MWDEIIAEVKSIIDANEKKEEAYDYEVSGFEGFPAVTITPSGNDSDYSSTTENEIVYAVLIRCFVPRGGQDDENSAEKTMRELVDSIMRDFAKDGNNRLTNITTPAGYTMLVVEAIPSNWGYMGNREEELRVAEITLRVHVHVDVTAIS